MLNQPASPGFPASHSQKLCFWPEIDFQRVDPGSAPVDSYYCNDQKNSVSGYDVSKGRLSSVMVRIFTDYWTEMNPAGTVRMSSWHKEDLIATFPGKLRF